MDDDTRVSLKSATFASNIKSKCFGFRFFPFILEDM